MNGQMTTNSQLSTTEPKKQNKKKYKTKLSKRLRTRTESQKWRSHGGLPVGRWRMGEKEQGIRSVTGRYKIGKG